MSLTIASPKSPMVSPNFTGKAESDYYRKVKPGHHIMIEDLFAIKPGKSIIIPQMSGSEELTISKSMFENKISVKGSKGEVLTASCADGKFPKIKMLTGKSGISAHVVLPNNVVGVMIPGSAIEGNNFRVNMPSFSGNKNIGFKGHIFANVAETADGYNVARTIKEYYKRPDLHPSAAKSFNPNYNVYIPSSGEGTRLYNLVSANYETNVKPNAMMPDKSKMIQNIQIALHAGGLLDAKDKPTILMEKVPSGSASGLVRMLDKGQIKTDKPLVQVGNDAFTTIDFNDVIKDYESKNAGLMIIGKAVPAKDTVKKLGIIQADENGLITGFAEKPNNLEEAQFGKIPGSDKINANTAMYVFAPEVLQWMKGKIDAAPRTPDGKDTTAFLKPGQGGKVEYDFAMTIFPDLIKALNNDEIMKADGTPLKVYTHVTEKEWTDVGNTGDYIKLMRDIAHGPAGVPGGGDKVKYSENVDKDTGVVYLNGAKEALAKASTKGKGVKAEGNVIMVKK